MSNATQEIIHIVEALPEEKQTDVADFARFLLTRQQESAWKATLADPRKRPRLEAFLAESAAEGDEPLDPSRLRIPAHDQAAEEPTSGWTIRREADRRAYAMFAQNPEHPSLKFKKLGGYDNIWSARINEQYRAIGVRSGDTIACPGSARILSLIIYLADMEDGAGYPVSTETVSSVM